MFQSKMKSFSWVLNDEWNASHGWVCQCHGVFNEEKFEFDEMSFDLSWKMVKWSERVNLLNQKYVFTWKNFGLRNKIFLKNGVKSSFVEKKT